MTSSATNHIPLTHTHLGSGESEPEPNPLNDDDDTDTDDGLLLPGAGLPIGQCDPVPREPVDPASLLCLDPNATEKITALLTAYEAACDDAEAAQRELRIAGEHVEKTRLALEKARQAVRGGFFRLGMENNSLVRVGDRAYQFRHLDAKGDMVTFTQVPLFQQSER